MKNKSKKAKFKKRSEFRYHNTVSINAKGKKKNIRHPAYIFLEKGNIFIYISLTHSKEIKNVLLIKLRRNPKPKDNRDAYRVVEIRKDTKDAFGKRLKKWVIDPLDEEDIRKEFTKKDDSAD